MRITIILATLAIALAGPALAQGKSDSKSGPSTMSTKKPGMSCTDLKSGSQAHKDCIAGAAKAGKTGKADKMERMKGNKK